MTGIDFHVPTVETERLRLRAPLAKDFDAYADYRAAPRSASVGGPFDRATSFMHMCALMGHWQMRGYGRWIVADRVTDDALGVVGPYFPEDWPEPEIAWTVFDAAEGKGIAQEAALASRTFAYQTLGWTTVMSAIAPDNTRSVALARRMGATCESRFVHPTYGALDIWRHQSPGDCL